MGDSPRSISLEDTWRLSMTTYLHESIYNVGVMGVIGFSVLMKYKVAPAKLKRLGLALPIYTIIFFIFAQWYEIRLFLTVMPIVIPMILYVKDGSEDERRTNN